MAVFTYPNPSSLVFPSTGGGGGGGITWSTPIDSNITVDTDYTYDLGATGGGLNNIYVGAVYGPAGDNFVELGDNDILISSSVGPVTVQVADTEPFQVDTANSATNSGNITLTIGTAGGTQGEIKLLKSGVAPTVGDIWTATNADGSGYWAAPSGGGANTSLSNLTTTDINQDLILNTGAQAFIKTFDDPAGQSQSLDIGSGLAGAGFSTGNVTLRAGAGDVAVGYVEIRGADTSSVSDPGGSIFLTAGDGGTDSGDITLDPRTNGEIILAHSSKGTVGDVWTSTDTNGAGAWAAPSGSGTVTSVALSAPSFLSVSGSPVTTSGTLALSLSGTPIRMADGSTSAPSYSFSGSTDTGMYASGTDLGLVADGVHIVSLTAGGGTPTFKPSADNTLDLGSVTQAWKVVHTKNTYIRYGELRFYDSDQSNYISLYPGATIPSNIILQLPTSQGAAGTMIQTDGAGVLSFSGQASQFFTASADPGSPAAGQVYFNTTSNKLKVYSGTAWETITSV